MICKSSVGDSSELVWFKSSYSDSGNSNECVEVATTPLSILVRDSKAPRSAALPFPLRPGPPSSLRGDFEATGRRLRSSAYRCEVRATRLRRAARGADAWSSAVGQEWT